MMAGRSRRGSEAFTVRACGAPNCPSLAMEGSPFCPMHHGSALGAEVERELAVLVRETDKLATITDPHEKERAAGRFRARLESGEFAGLFSKQSRKALKKVGKAAELTPEIGIVRVAMQRLLDEEADAARFAHAASRGLLALVRAQQWEHKRRADMPTNDQLMAEALNAYLALPPEDEAER